MRRIRLVRFFLNRFFRTRRVLRMLRGAPAWMMPALCAAAETADKSAEKIAVFPTTPYHQYIVYESLAIFWIAILGLVVIIRMKLREIERIQKLGIEEEDPNAPLLR